jgi:hypothetical protein
MADPFSQPKLSDLMTRYLSRQAGAHAEGLASFDPTGEVVAYDAGPVQAVDPRPAWEEAVAVAALLAPKAQPESWQAPPLWPELVAAQEPAVALAFCLGNYPQIMRDLHVILHKADLTELRPQAAQEISASGLVEWADQKAGQKHFPHVVLALGVLRLARHFEAADRFVQSHDRAVPAEWRATWANEKAALAWHRGRAERAYQQWCKEPASVPVLFNRGMAALFLGRPADAIAPLTDAVAALPESRAWHHLGRLYLTLAQSRR